MSSKSISVIHRATAAIIEGLEERRLMSAVLTVVNPLGLPSNNRLIFNRIQNPNTTVPNVVHDTNSLQIKNTGDQPLVISSLTLSGPFAFVSPPAGNYANTTLAAGASITVTIRFTQTTLPPHGNVNETNFTTNPNGGAAITGSLTISSNSATNPSQSIALAGYWQDQSESNEEPNLTTIINTLNGYSTTISDPYSPDLTETSTSAVYYGQEVKSDFWSQANSAQSVGITEIATFHTQGNVVHTYWYSASTQASHLLMTSQANQGQTLLPTFASGAPMAASFNPGGSFGIRVDNEYSTDAINVANGNASSAGHHVRFYPLVDASGHVVANTYIMAMDYAVLQTENYDFQDNVYIISNITPTTAPPAPTNLTASNTAAPTLNWTGVTYSNLAGYNVYRSTSATGSFTKLTGTPTTATSFTDSTAPGGTLYYRVTAVDSVSGNESAPATATANTPSGPVAQADAFTANTAQPTLLNVLANDTDASGTLNANSVTIVSGPNHGGTATVNTTSGAVSYTSTSGFTGTETFTYTVTDSNGTVSQPATVTVTVVNGGSVTPTATNDTAVVLAGSAVTINVLSNDTTPNGTFNPGTVVVRSAAGHGGTSVDSGTGLITYTPNPGFVGSDSFTYAVTDSNSNTTNTARVTVDVGVAVGTGQNKSVTYKDSSGATGIVTLNLGVADVYFTGDGTVTTNKGKATVTGSSLTIGSIGLTGTTAASVLSIRSVGGKGTLNLGGITDAGTLGKVNAPTTKLTGVVNNNTVNIAGLSILQIQSADTAEIAIGSTGVSSFSFTALGDVVDSDLNSGVTIRQLKAASWKNTQNNVLDIAAPSISSLIVAGAFEPNLDLTGNASSAVVLGNARIGGAVDFGYWNIGGGISSATLGSVTSAWGSTITGGVSKLMIRKGGLPSDISAATFGTVTVTGDLTGSITAGSAQAIRVTGAVSNGTLSLTNGTGTVLGQLKVGGAISNSTVSAAGAIGNVTANALTASTLVSGASSSLTVASASTANIGTGSINVVKLIGRGTTAFSDSSIIAKTMNTLNLGSINTANGGKPTGVAAMSIRLATFSVDGKVDRLNAVTTQNFGDFELRIL